MRSFVLPLAALLSLPLAIGACGDRKPAAVPKASTSAGGTNAAGGTNVAPQPTDNVTGDAPPPPPPDNSGALTGGAKAQYDQGVAAYRAGDLAGAAQHFQAAVSAEPKGYEAHFALGMTYERMGKTADALESYRNAYKLNPNYDQAIAAYGFLLYRQGSKTEAESFLNEQSAKNPKAYGVKVAYGEIKSLQGDSTAAQQLAGDVLTQEAKYEPAMVLIARDHYRRGRTDLANYVLAAILDGQRTAEEKEKDLPAKANPPRAPNNPEAHLLRAIILQKAGDRLGAAKWFESASKLRPDLVEAQLQLGLIRLEANDAEGAVGPLTKAVQFAPNNIEAHLALGDALRLTGGRGPDAKKEYLWVLSAPAASAQTKALAQYDLGLLYFLTPGLDGLTDVQRYDRSVDYWNQYKGAKGTATGASWPADADDLIEQARRARNAAAAAGGGGGAATPKSPTPTPAGSSAKPATSAAPAASGSAKPAASGGK
jgi:Tfp pilus assembly protein PilF